MPSIHVNFEGGLQIDFNAPNGVDMNVPDGTTLGQLPILLVQNVVDKNHPIRFLGNEGSVVPGILTMINDVDSEIVGNGALLNPGDCITYISTLHGG